MRKLVHMKQKKGMIGEQINWIYVMIAGTLILGFFVGIVYRQKQAADRGIAEDILKGVDALTSYPPRSSQLVHIPGLELYISCKSGRTTLRAENSQSTREPYEPVFGPSLIKANHIITMTDEWNVPFKATNFIFLTGNDTRYVVFYDSPESEILAKMIIEELPVQSNKKIVAKGSLVENDNTRRAVLIGAMTEPDRPAWADSLGKELVAMTITVHQPAREDQPISGTANYCQKSGTGFACSSEDFKTYFFGKAMLKGIIYSGSKPEYECRIERAMDRLNNVANVYSGKVRMLNEKAPSLPSVCSDKYDSGNVEMLKGLKVQGISRIREIEMEVWEQNMASLQQSCPTIY